MNMIKLLTTQLNAEPNFNFFNGICYSNSAYLGMSSLIIRKQLENETDKAKPLELNSQKHMKNINY